MDFDSTLDLGSMENAGLVTFPDKTWDRKDTGTPVFIATLFAVTKVMEKT